MLSVYGSKSLANTRTFYLGSSIDHLMQFQNTFRQMKLHLIWLLTIDTTTLSILSTSIRTCLQITQHEKINSHYSEFALHQSISEPTHYIETSTSLIDLIFVLNQDSLIASGVRDLFLVQDLRYSCPVFGLLKFLNLKLNHTPDKPGTMTEEISNFFELKLLKQSRTHYVTKIWILMQQI